MSNMDVEEALTMLEAIETNLDTTYRWVDSDFIESLGAQVEQGRTLSEKQLQAIVSIYEGARR